MKVIHVITGLQDGGAEAVLYRLCIHEKNCEHVVISLMDQGRYGSLLGNFGIAVHCLNMSSGRVSISGLVTLFRLIKKLEPDVVQTWMYHADIIGGFIARLSGVKNIVWGVHHSTLSIADSKLSTVIIARINAFLSHFIPNKIIYCADASREVQESIGFNRKKGYVINNGYNVDEFIPSYEMGGEFRAELGVDDNCFLLGHVGRYSPYKDYPNLLKSVSLLSGQNKNIKLVMVGSELDEGNDELVGMLNALQLSNKVFLLGRREDIPRIMNGVDLFLLSSITEAFPNVLNESMSCKTPCVTTDVGDAAFIVGSTGWVVPPGSPALMKEAILQAIDERFEAKDCWIARKNDCRTRIVERFSIDTMVHGYCNVWFN